MIAKPPDEVVKRLFEPAQAVSISSPLIHLLFSAVLISIEPELFFGVVIHVAGCLGGPLGAGRRSAGGGVDGFDLEENHDDAIESSLRASGGKAVGSFWVLKLELRSPVRRVLRKIGGRLLKKKVWCVCVWNLGSRVHKGALKQKVSIPACGSS